MLTFTTLVSSAAAPQQSQQPKAVLDKTALNRMLSIVTSSQHPDYKAAQAAYSSSLKLKSWAAQDPEISAAMKEDDEHFRNLLTGAQTEEAQVQQGFVDGMLRTIGNGVLDKLEWSAEDWLPVHSVNCLIRNIRNLKPNHASFSQATSQLNAANKKLAAVKNENEDLKRRVEALRAARKQKQPGASVKK